RSPTTTSRSRICSSLSPFPPVPVLEPDDVVKLWRRDLENVGVLEGRHPMDGLRRDVNAFARPHFPRNPFLIDLDLEKQTARMKVYRLVLEVVILKAQGMPGPDVNELSDVTLRLGPVQFVPPWLLDPRHFVRH